MPKVEKDDGGSRIHVTCDRTGTSFIGRVAVALISLTKGKPVADSMKKALKKMEPSSGTQM
jgi:hypothetical protein